MQIFRCKKQCVNKLKLTFLICQLCLFSFVVVWWIYCEILKGTDITVLLTVALLFKIYVLGVKICIYTGRILLQHTVDHSGQYTNIYNTQHTIIRKTFDCLHFFTIEVYCSDVTVFKVHGSTQFLVTEKRSQTQNDHQMIQNHDKMNKKRPQRYSKQPQWDEKPPQSDTQRNTSCYSRWQGPLVCSPLGLFQSGGLAPM